MQHSNMLPINASTATTAERIARRMFVKDAPAGVKLVALGLASVEPVRPFDRVAAAETTDEPVSCFVFAVTWER